MVTSSLGPNEKVEFPVAFSAGGRFMVAGWWWWAAKVSGTCHGGMWSSVVG